MKFKSKEFFISLVVLLFVFLAQLWLIDFKFFEALNLKLFVVMFFNIMTLSIVSSKNKKEKLPRIVAYQTLLVTSMSMVMLVSSNTFIGEFNYIESILKPIFIGIFIYVFFYSGYLVFEVNHVENETKLSRDDVFNQLGLTPREKALSNLIFKGYTNKEIAKELYIAETTVKKHIQNIFRKVDVANKLEFKDKLKNY